MTERLYKVAWTYDDIDDAPYVLEEELGDVQRADPEGWAEYAQEMWGEYKPFFWPSTKRIYRSRSAAVERAALINRWGGNVIVLECTPEWVTLTEAQRKRDIRSQLKRLEALHRKLDATQAAADEVYAKIDALVVTEGVDQ